MDFASGRIGYDVVCSRLGTGVFRIIDTKPRTREFIVSQNNGPPQTIFAEHCGLGDLAMRMANSRRLNAERLEHAHKVGNPTLRKNR